jgi:hypothetical protein
VHSIPSTPQEVSAKIHTLHITEAHNSLIFPTDRMLAVGDPMQLPPTIISRRASDLGLSKSMHDRLMNDCDEEYFMLVRNFSVLSKLFQCCMKLWKITLLQ